MTTASLASIPSRTAALAAREWDADDPRIISWEQAFRRAVSDLQDDAGLQFLQNYLLAPGDWSAIVVLRPSWAALELLDHWFPTNFVEVLQAASRIQVTLATGTAANPFRLAMSAHPMLAMLSQHHPATDKGGVQVAKALLLGAMFQGSLLATAASVRECADGLRKSLVRADWGRLLDWDGLEYGLPLRDTLGQAAELIEAASRLAASSRNVAHAEFVSALREVVNGLLAGSARIPARQGAAIGAEADEDDGVRPDRPVSIIVPELATEESATSTAESARDTAVGSAGEAQEDLPAAARDERSEFLGGETDEHAEFRAMRTGFRAAITNQYLPVDHDQLLAHECEALTTELEAGLRGSKAIERRVAALLSVSLFTGETLTSILASKVDPLVRPGFTSTGRWLRVVRPEPQARVPTPAQRRMLARHGDRFELAMPMPVERYFAEALKGMPPGTVLADALGVPSATLTRQAHEWLADFRKRYPRVLLGKIARWLPTALYAQSHDQVATHLLTAIESDPPCPSAYYRSPQAAELQQLHTDLVAGHWPGRLSKPRTPVVRVGSWWYPRKGELERLYLQVSASLKRRADDDALPLWRRHRAHQVLSALNLLLGTGSRPVNDPVESLSMLDLERALAVLDDKSSGPARGHRIVPLCPMVVGQIRAQIEYLARLAGALAAGYPNTAAAIAAIVQFPERRIAPLFLLLDEAYGIRSLTPGDIAKELGDLWPLPLNFGRHWLSTALYEAGASDASIAAFLGHVLIGTQNLSPLAMQTADELFATLRPALAKASKDFGLEVVRAEHCVPYGGPYDAGLNVSVIEPLIEFGGARRARQRALEEEALQRTIDEFIQSRTHERDLKSLGRKDIERLFEKLNDLSPNSNNHRAFRLRQLLRSRLAVVARRHLKDWPLPSVEVGLADFQIAVEPDALLAFPRVTALRNALKAELRGPSGVKVRSARKAQGPTTGVLALALVTECLVLDEAVIRAWIASPSAEIIEIRAAASDGAESECWIRVDVNGVGSRLHPIPPWLAGLLPSLLGKGLVAGDRKSADRDVDRFARDHELHWLRGGLREAMQTVRSAASLGLSGMSLAFATGLHGSVSLPAGTIERLVLGALKPATRDALLAASKSPSVDPGLDVVADDQVIRHTAVAKDLAGVVTFLDMVGQCFEDAAKFSVTKHARMAFGRSRVEFLGHLLEERFEALQQTSSVPPICGHLLSWLHAMCDKGRLKGGDYSFKTITTYWSNASRRLIEQVDASDMSVMDPVEIEEIYFDLIEFAETERQDHIYTALRVFHAHMMKRHGVPGIDWGPLAALAGSGPSRVDANLVTEAEYLDALRMLRADEHVDVRRRRMQTAILILCFRGGLRIGETFGLRRKDIACIGGVWIVRVAKNLYRTLKSDTSMRVVPFLERLDPMEHETLMAWVEHADEYLDGRSTTALFTRSTQTRELAPRSQVALRLRVALREATGDPGVRVHHCRHGLPNRLIAAAGAWQRTANIHLKQLVSDWPKAADILGVLTQQDAPTRRLIWAVANLMGHAPSTLLRSYFHLGSELLGREVREGWWSATDRAVHTAATKHSASTALVMSPRVPLAVSLVEEAALPLEPVVVDRAIDMLRRYARADGVSDALLLPERQVQAIALAAQRMVLEARGEYSERQDWWFAGAQVQYSAGQVQQIRRSLDALPHALDEEIRLALSQVGACVDERQFMLIVNDQQQFERLAALLRLLVDDPANVELVLPTATVKRKGGLPAGQGEPIEPRPKRGRPGRYSPQRPLAIADEVWAPWRELAAAHGFNVTSRSHLMGTRLGGRNRKARQIRCGLRIRQNSTDLVRDAKTATRIVTVAAVWLALSTPAVMPDPKASSPSATP